jgi:hypothetical protein
MIQHSKGPFKADYTKNNKRRDTPVQSTATWTRPGSLDIIGHLRHAESAAVSRTPRMEQ